MSRARCRLALLSFAPPLGILILVFTVCRLHGRVPLSFIVRDPAAGANVHPFIGALSVLGVLLWCATAAISVFVSFVLREQERKDFGAFLLWSGILTGLLLMDDQFMIHEFIAPSYFRIPQAFVLFFYAGFATFILGHYRAVMAQTHRWLFFTAVGFFGLSIGLDLLGDELKIHLFADSDFETFVEDGAKFVGIGGWCGYYVSVCYAQVISLHLPGARVPLGTAGAPHGGSAHREHL